MKILRLLWLVLLTGTSPAAWAGACLAVPALAPPAGPLGRCASFYQETGPALDLRQAVAAYTAGRFRSGHNAVLTFGIGPRPVWIRLAVDNTGARAVERRLSVDTPWLDHVDVYFLRGGRVAASYRVGDREPFADRPVPGRFFAFDHRFPPGVTDVYLRVRTPDPMVVPIRLRTLAEARSADRARDYGYGFLYGFLFALMAYNLMLYAGLRDSRYALYSLYLAAFVGTNISYSGHGFEWLWPHATVWEQWSNPILILVYGLSGLAFALRFLDIREHFPRVSFAVRAYVAAAAVAFVLGAVVGGQRGALLVSFGFIFLFSWIMLGLGVISVRGGHQAGRYFLLAAIAAMIGAMSTTLAVWGFVPYDVWTFHAVEVGMLLDATLLALALTYRFREGQTRRINAEQLAKLDLLTRINNRRGFYDVATPIWSIAVRHGHDLSVILMDLDHFKRINDRYGHTCGDEVLVATAKALKSAMRDQDVLARWGGEEFILLLPETGLEEAGVLAERLRGVIAGVRIRWQGADITITASFGVAERAAKHRDIDAVISAADKNLYRSKNDGRDRVVAA